MSLDSVSWLRPSWLWALIPLLMVSVWWFKQQRGGTAWEKFVDPELQPYVIEDVASSKRWSPWLLLLSWAFCVLLLAGPVWQQQEVPVFQGEQAEVILFDLSQSMRSDDMLPDRLTRARFKLIDFLRRSEGRQTGLIAFAERPYIISPLTEDASTVEAFVPSLDPDIIPVQGSRLDLAIERAVMLLMLAGVAQGHIIILSDATVTDVDRTAASAAYEAGHRVSVLALGTSAGSPLRDAQGQFVQRSNGAIVVTRLDMPGMQSLASAGGGVAVELSSGSQDLDTLDRVRLGIAISGDTNEARAEKIYWIEYAPWGLWVLLIMLLGAFRKGVLM